jgi:ParB-like chromosome segregation protein Spo0J
MDGTFDVIEGILNIKDAGPVSQEVLAKMLALAQNAAAGKTDPKTALDEIAEFLPRESAAAKEAWRAEPSDGHFDRSCDHQHSC